jgi:uncharacterized iron-regulated protein
MEYDSKGRIMKKKLICAAIIAAAAILAGSANTAKSSYQKSRLYDLANHRIVMLANAVQTLEDGHIVLVGEQHTNADHHLDQLAVIDALQRAGKTVAIGMEMFRSDSQPDLNRWVAGSLSEKQFIKIYYENWNYDWPLYAPILKYAREHGLAVQGLNVSRSITAQVARRGFQSLTKEQRGELAGITCRVDKVYMAFIRRAYGAHAHGNLNFEYFCEAQLVWDSIMAINAHKFIEQNPDHILVIIAGNGHAWKGGIPTQLANRGHAAYTVILPHVPGFADAQTLTARDADYIFLD